MFLLFSGQVFASNASACDEVKQNKGLHGLCVAWHNANEKNKDKFAAKYSERSGGSRVPGSFDQNTPTGPDFYCPCWTEVSFSDVCSLDSPSSSVLLPDFGAVTYEDGLDEWFSADNPASDVYGCIYAGKFSAEPIIEPDLTTDEGIDCMAEIAAIASMYNGGSCN
ncbi:hypothetical protein ACFL1C_10420 [Pseudomonadota bacterium]